MFARARLSKLCRAYNRHRQHSLPASLRALLTAGATPSSVRFLHSRTGEVDPKEPPLTSFLAYAIANIMVGIALSAFSFVSLYTPWESRERSCSVVFSYSVTFWLGILTLGGLRLAIGALPRLDHLPIPALIRPAGWLMMTAPFAYVATTAIKRRPFRFRRFELPLPSPRLACTQLVISCLDWTLAGAVLYVLLPSSPLGFLEFLGAFLAAILRHGQPVPGGLECSKGSMISCSSHF